MTKVPGPKFRSCIYDSVVDTIGATTIIRLSRFTNDAGIARNILAKCEFYNPLSSDKDQIGLAMIEAAESCGKINVGTALVEPTSGNTGIVLAFVCVAKGYYLILTMPKSMSIERRKILLLLGAKIKLTPPTLGMRGAIDKAKELAASIPNSIIHQQFDNPANPEIHRNTTAEEIENDTNGHADVLVSVVSTGGTLTGCAEVLKKYNPNCEVVAVEPEDGPILSGGTPGPHKIQGIGAGFVPKSLNATLIDEVLKIGNETAFAVAHKVARLEGLACSISSGAALAAALEIAEQPNMAGENIITILPSYAEQYLSTALFDGLE